MSVAVQEVHDVVHVEGRGINRMEGHPCHGHRKSEDRCHSQSNDCSHGVTLDQSRTQKTNDGHAHQCGPEGEPLKSQDLKCAAQEQLCHRSGATQSEKHGDVKTEEEWEQTARGDAL